MTRSIPESAREHADLALAVYVEELAARRRVLFVGDASSAVPERLSSVARSVEVVSPRTRARGTRRGGRILPRPWPSVSDARSWDLVLVPDLLWAGPPAPERITEMAEWLTARGVLVVGAEEREDGLGYEPLYELLAKRFDQVRMLGQAPFAGWAVVDFAPASRELEVTFDGSLLGRTGEEPSRFLALCSAREVVLDPYAIVQVPAGASPSAPREPRVATEPDAPSQARISQLEIQLRNRQEDVGRAQGHAEELERELGAVRARVEHAERRLEQAQREITRGSHKLDEARAKADALAAEATAARAELDATRGAPAEGIDEDYARLETQLADRGSEITALRGEIDRRGILVRDLVEELRELRAREWAASEGNGAPMPSGGVIGSGGAVAAGSPGSAGVGARALDAAAPSPPEPAARASAPEMPRPASALALEEALATARRRAVDAEASLAEAAFRIDEVRAELALCRKQRDAEREIAQRELASSAGTTRGLNARLAEAEELRRLGEARLALSLDDVVAARARIKDLERDLADARDHVGLSFARAHGRPRPAEGGEEGGEVRALEQRLREVERERSEREAQLRAELDRARERATQLEADRERLERDLSLAVETAASGRESHENDRASLEANLAELADEGLRVASEGERRAREIAQLRAEGSDRDRELQTLRGEREGLRLRLEDAEAALAAQLAHSAAAPPSAEREAEHHALRARVDELDAAARAHSSRVEDSLARAEQDRKRAEELATRMAARDALIARLESEVADEVARRDALGVRAAELDRALLELREALETARAVADVRAEEERRETRRIEERLADVERARSRSESEHDETRAALAEARQILAQIASGLDGPGGSPSSSGGDSRVREQLEALQREAADRELMLRSLTAQLQDRDDRIRALDRLETGGVEADALELQRRALLAEERAVRLERELEQERTARRDAETGSAPDADLRRLHQLLGDRDANLMVLEGRITATEREGRAMRDAFAQARAGLETLLGEIASDQRAEAADRIASLLRVLRRY
jgi:chromosome segregation ATPase